MPGLDRASEVVVFGMLRSALRALAWSVCGCGGVCGSSNVTVGDPAVSPQSYMVPDGALPQCIGAVPCKFGSPKFDLPSPPKVVPSSENSAVFWEIGSSWPWQNAHPVGAKLHAHILISATNGEDTARLSILGRVDAEQGKDECHTLERLHVVV